MRLIPTALAAFAMLAPLHAEAAAGDKQAGQVRSALCQACHGPADASAMPAVPVLAGQTDQFLQWQLVFFRTGRRHNPVMQPLAQDLSDADVRNLGAYFASQPPPAIPASDNDPTLTARGSAVAQDHHCAACHTDAFTGKAAAARLAGQHEAYLATALADYRSGDRPSTGVAAMTEAASGLTDDDITALAHFLATLPP